MLVSRTAGASSGTKSWSRALRCFTSTQQILAGKLADHCDLHIVESPFPPIPSGPYAPTPEMVMENWKGSSSGGGYLDKEVAIFDGSTGLKRTFRDYYQDTTGLAGSFKHEMDVEETSCVCLFAPSKFPFRCSCSPCRHKIPHAIGIFQILIRPC